MKIKFRLGPYVFGLSASNSRKIPTVHQLWTKREDEELLLFYRQGATVKELSEVFDRPEDAIRCRIKNLVKLT